MMASPPKPTLNTRQAPRVEGRFQVRYGVGDALATGESFDLGAGGLGITGPEVYPVGTELNIHFRAPDRETALLRMKAIVRHSTPGRMGVSFVNVPHSDHARVLRMVELLLKQQRTGK